MIKAGYSVALPWEHWGVKKSISDTHRLDFPDGPVATSLSADVGDTGSILGSGTKIPHALRQLSLNIATIEAWVL